MELYTTSVNGIEVHHLEAGTSAGPGALPFVMLHGFTGHRDDFAEPLPRLARERRVLAPDLRGHGGSLRDGDPADYRFPQLVDDLARWLDRLEIPNCDLLGHSFGGMLALRFVLAHPERVRSLVLMSTSPFAPPETDRARIQKAGAIAVAKGMPAFQELVERGARANHSPRPSDLQTRKWELRYWAHHRTRYLDMDPVAYGALGLAMVDQASLVPRLGEIRCPTTAIVGAEDEGFLSGADAFEQGIPGVVRVTLPDAGHHPHMENPEAWHAALAAHFARVEASAG